MMPAFPLAIIRLRTFSVSEESCASPPNRHASIRFSASCPYTELSFGAVMGARGANSGRERLRFGFHEPKYLSIRAITLSGLKSPDMHTAMLLGT